MAERTADVQAHWIMPTALLVRADEVLG